MTQIDTFWHTLYTFIIHPVPSSPFRHSSLPFHIVKPSLFIFHYVIVRSLLFIFRTFQITVFYCILCYPYQIGPKILPSPSIIALINQGFDQINISKREKDYSKLSVLVITIPHAVFPPYFNTDLSQVCSCHPIKTKISNPEIIFSTNTWLDPPTN